MYMYFQIVLPSYKSPIQTQKAYHPNSHTAHPIEQTSLSIKVTVHDMEITTAQTASMSLKYNLSILKSLAFKPYSAGTKSDKSLPPV